MKDLKQRKKEMSKGREREALLSLPQAPLFPPGLVVPSLVELLLGLS